MFPYRSLILSVGGTLFATMQIFNFSFLSSHVGDLYPNSGPTTEQQASAQLYEQQSSQLSSSSQQQRQLRGGSTNEKTLEAAETNTLSVEEREERDRRLAMLESDSDLSELSKDAFAGCLMIMDDNHFLVEWLAYHYHVLNLKHLTILIDTKSQTSPLSIFDRWSDRIQIEVVNWEWPGVLVPVPKGDYLENQTDIRHYIGRQNMFLQQCMTQYKRRNWNSWVILTDTDEFIGVNRWVDFKAHPMFDNVIPSANETGSVVKRLQQMSHLGDTCILTNRTHSCEETTPTELHLSDSLGLNDHDFLSFEWNLGHTLKNPKAMVDIGKIPLEYFENELDLNNQGNVHNLLPGRECNDRPHFRMYHYPGSEKQRTFRDSIDPRGPAATRVGGSRPLVQRQCTPMPTNHLHPWLDGFQKNTLKGNVEEAKRLLQGVGQTGPWPKYQKRIM